MLASILRNTKSYGLDQPPRLGADDVARLPAVRVIDTAAYPSEPVTLVDSGTDPVTCAAWSKPEGAQTASLSLLSGAALPIPDGMRTVDLVSSGTPGGPADRVALSPGTGYFVDGAGALFWVSDTGVRYGIDTGGTGADAAGADTVAALGLTTAPLPIPWSVLSHVRGGSDAVARRRTPGPRHTRAQPGTGAVGHPWFGDSVSRLIFEHRKRISPPATRKGTITIEPPPELPRVVPPSLLRRALPYLIVILIVGMIVALVATGMRLISPTTLFFPFVLLLAATALYRGSDNKMRTEEVDAERADYLRYLSVVRDNVRAHADEQRAALLWSHPEPVALASIPGTRRQWERDPRDPDFLVLRAGLHDQALDATLRVKDTADEIDLEPVSHSTLRGLLDTQRTVHDAPAGIDLTRVARVTVIGDDGRGRRRDARVDRSGDDVARPVSARNRFCRSRSGGRRLVVAEMAAARRHARPGRRRRPGPLPRRRTHCPAQAAGSGPCRSRAVHRGRRGQRQASAHRARRPGRRPRRLHRPRPRRGDRDPPVRDTSRTANSIRIPSGPSCGSPTVRIQRWQNGGWSLFIDAADRLASDDARHIARRLSRWDSNPSHGRSATTGGATFTTLLGIPDASALDVAALWAPRNRDDELRVPIGVTATGEPLYFDLKDEAEGGMGPHGLMIGMTGSGKSQTLMSILLSLLTTHSAERLIVIYADFKGEAGADIFRNFPQVVAVISNMAEKRSLADRFADTLRGEVARREQLLKETGRRVQGSAFNSVTEYEAAIAAGHDLPPLPTLFVVADEFTLMLADHPEYADLFDYVARKGRSFRIHILFASQTLDVGRIKDIDKNTSYRIGLKVASPSVSRQIIGVEDAYHIESGREHKGVGFLVPAPGARPIKFRSTYVDGIYEPPTGRQVDRRARDSAAPQLFSAGWVDPEPDTVIVDDGADVEVLPPRKLIATIGDQLAHYGPRAPQLWLPPLDESMPLDDVLMRAGIVAGQWRWPLGEIDRPFEMRRDPLVFDATLGGGQHGDPRRPEVGQVDGTADLRAVGCGAARPRRRHVLLPRLRRRATARPRRSRPRRQRGLTAGVRTDPPHVRRARAAAAGAPEGRCDPQRRVPGRLRRGVPGHRQPVRVQPGQHRHLQHPEPVAGQGDRAGQRRDCPTASTS